MRATSSDRAGGRSRTRGPEPPNESAREQYHAFWATMDRCPTIEALEREFDREARRRGASQSTVEAFMMSLRDRGIAALAEPDTRRRLSELSSAQVVECMGRIIQHRAKYPDADDLLLVLSKQAEPAE